MIIRLGTLFKFKFTLFDFKIFDYQRRFFCLSLLFSTIILFLKLLISIVFAPIIGNFVDFQFSLFIIELIFIMYGWLKWSIRMRMAACAYIRIIPSLTIFFCICLFKITLGRFHDSSKLGPTCH